jgi:putative SOS response-associated peptidase YedK
VSVASDAELSDEFDVEERVGQNVPPSWNVAPTDPVRMVVQRSSRAQKRGVRQLRTARWGLVPNWSRDARGGAKMINARVETVTSKPAFKTAAARRRCLLPALGYYEWQQGEQGKIPYFLRNPQGGTLAMAALYELWRDPTASEDDPNRGLWTCTVITAQAPDVLGEIHERNPVIVPRELYGAWLDCSSADLTHAAALLQQLPQARLAPHPVSAAVGNVRNNGPELIEPVDPRAPVRPQQLEL